MLIISLIAIIFPFKSAFSAPDKVYRLDTRSPSTVLYSTGIPSSGNNYDLIEHVSGESITDRTTGLVSITESMEVIRQISSNRFRTNSQVTFWLYEITPTTNFYSTNASLQHSSSLATDLAAQIIVNTTLSAFSWEQEYVSQGPIPRERISSARSISLDAQGQVVISSAATLNSAYVSTTPAVNSGFLSSTVTTGGNVYYLGDDNNHNPFDYLSLGFDPSGCGGRAGRASAVSGYNAVKETFKELRVQQEKVVVGVLGIAS